MFKWKEKGFKRFDFFIIYGLKWAGSQIEDPRCFYLLYIFSSFLSPFSYFHLFLNIIYFVFSIFILLIRDLANGVMVNWLEDEWLVGRLHAVSCWITSLLLIWLLICLLILLFICLFILLIMLLLISLFILSFIYFVIYFSF